MCCIANKINGALAWTQARPVGDPDFPGKNVESQPSPIASRRNYSESPTTSPTGGDGSNVDEQYLLR